MTTTNARIRTAKEQEVDQALAKAGHESLEAFVRDQRPESWPEIAFAVRQATGIAVPEGTLRRWYASWID